MGNLKSMISLDNPARLTYHKLRAITANIINGFPSKNMVIVGVTGTNGKTTTCNIIARGLIKEGKKVFMFTTVNVIIGDQEFVNNTKMTSPDPFLLQKYLKMAKEKGCEIAIIETASHGIKMHRIWGIEYDICVLTNITQDHLDLHRTMRDYVKTKLTIFKKLIAYKRKPGIKKTAVLNMNSAYLDDFLDQTYDSLYKYGDAGNANVRAENLRIEGQTTKFDITTAGSVIKIETSLKGQFNVENILAAVCVFIAFGIDPKKIPEMIKDVTGVPGRMEKVENDIGADIYVDYAHTADALEKVLTSLRNYNYNKIVTVFGATGSRDKTKRPEMGRIVDRNSDVIILTQDDDYAEKTEKIIKDVLPGIKRKEGENFWIIPTRREAIEAGIFALKKGDCLLVAGKGDEHTMITNSGAVPWHDKTVILEILKGIKDNQIIKN
ncbi:UDP-N-acetylmuramoyl-L-alanyl-D-glutamate--2,6-diaminopimelate ligase [Candidatus Gracilibacteria bacterium]|nr:MAG: UDP-N-acetylmuramoyl-L-alanyl-D-glutamate--2,6-diaminopimelate ligase [Candidatus Gracilibacteria bacterium]